MRHITRHAGLITGIMLWGGCLTVALLAATGTIR